MYLQSWGFHSRRQEMEHLGTRAEVKVSSVVCQGLALWPLLLQVLLDLATTATDLAGPGHPHC